MNTKHFLLAVLLVGMGGSALAAGPAATPGTIDEALRPAPPVALDKAFGDPTDLLAAATAAADYIRIMQADITEDNAGNGDPDQDLEDAGWDWALAPFEHSASASSGNLTGVIANSIMDVYELTGDAGLRTVLDDVAARELAIGPVPAYPTGLRYAGDIMFLLRYADLPGVANPADYRNAAVAVWDWRLNNTGTGTATSVAEAIRDGRSGQGYNNGIIAWDVGAYVEAVMMLHAAFPGLGYDLQGADMAEVLWQDSFNGNPGYFDVYGASQGYDPTYTNQDYWWYSLGVAGLIQAFATSGNHPLEILGLQSALLNCQYPDGAFGDQYGTPTDVNTRDWQTTAYAVRILDRVLPGNEAAMYAAGTWLAATQDASGGFVYSSGNHYPEIGAECAMALAAAYGAGASSVTASATFADPAQCGAVGDLSFFYDRSDGTPGLFGYELVVSITGPVTAPVIGDFVQVAPMDFFRVDANLDGTFTVNSTRFGADPGLLVDAELFQVQGLTTTGEGTVTAEVLSFRMRDPQNVPIFADMVGTSFTVDCTAPLPVSGITAEPGHDKVEVAWTHDGADTATYEVYRGLWYDTAVGVSAYPEYDDLPGYTLPTRPADRAAAAASGEWVLAGTVAVGTTAFTDIWPDETDRGIYSYEVFAVDAADNGSDAAAVNDYSLNYWLGDVSPIDGLVDNFDITALGAAFATTPADAAYVPAIDVGPTDDWSATGIPLTDNLIDFEDLMVFSLNYGVVGPAKGALPVAEVIDLAWTQREDGLWVLSLVGGHGLKGVRVRAHVPVNSVRAGDLLPVQGEQVFVTNAGTQLDANLALLGRGAAIAGHGELLVIDLPQEISARDLAIDLRSVDNAKLEFTLDKVTGSDLPTRFALEANYPNPFNPMTTITFALPAAQDVELVIYSLDGRRVATLLSEHRGPGTHQVVWTGRDDNGHTVASGIYLYRIDAGPHSQVRKMTLMK